MAEKESINQPKALIEAVPEEIAKLERKLTLEEKRKEADRKQRERSLDAWAPKTEVGKLVKAGKVKDFDSILNSGKKLIEAEIADTLLKLHSDLLLAGQAKGKFGGGKRRAWRQTQKKTMEGNVVTFSTLAVVGDENGHVGIGLGKAKETLPSREKALRQAKLGIIYVKRGFERTEASKDDPHTLPFVVEGKCGSVRIKLLPAPRGTGLVCGSEVKKILRLAGIKDAYAVTKGQTRTTLNFARACVDALTKTNMMRS